MKKLLILIGTGAFLVLALFIVQLKPEDSQAQQQNNKNNLAAAKTKKTAPVKKEPVKKEPVKTEPAKTEPAKTEPAKTEPAKTEPVKTEPVKPAPEQLKQLAVSATVPNVLTSGYLQYSIYKVELANAIEKSNPQAGHIFLLINLSISNSGSQIVGISPSMMFRLITKNESLSPIIQSDSEMSLQGKIGENRILSGDLRFEIPNEPGVYKLGIDPVEGIPMFVTLTVK